MSTADSTPPDALRAHSDRIAAIVDKLGASTVAVLGRRGAIASGCVWRSGLVVTAAHVFRRTPAALTLLDGAGAESRRRRWSASIRRPTSPCSASPTRTPWRRCRWREAAPVRAGHFAIAVGRSGEGDTVASAGLVNRVGGPWQTWLGGSIDRLIRLDGGVYDGLSGAPVADADGAVIGVATAALSRSYGIVVPTSTVAASSMPCSPTAASRGPGSASARRRCRCPTTAGAPAGEKSGLLVTSLAAGGPAERAGLLIGDIIVRAAETAAANLRELRQALAAHVGQTVAARRPARRCARSSSQASVGEWPGERRCH